MMKNKVLSRILSILLCVCVFCTSFTLTSFAAAAVAEWVTLIQTTMDTFDKVKTVFYQLKELGEIRSFEARATLIPVWRDLLRQKKMTKSEFLDFCNVWLDQDSTTIVEKFGTDAIAYREQMYEFITDSIFCFGGTEGLADFLYGSDIDDYEVTDDGKVQVPAKDVKEHITEANKLFFPKNTGGKMSFQTDKRWHNKYDGTEGAKYTILSLYDSFNGFQAVGGNEMYLVFFYKTADEMYYHTIQWHFTVTPEEIWATDRDEVETTYYHFVTEYWDMIEGSADKTTTNDFSGTYDYFNGSYRPLTTNTNEYFAIDYGNARFTFSSKYADYINYGECGYTLSGINPGTYSAYTSDLSKSLNIDPALFTNFDITSEVADIGYVASTTPIETIYKIDTTKIPDNYYITIQGDNIYDYSITNPETGQSDTINNYITNNYTYITSPDNNNSGSGSGTVGGNVTVGGKVDIGGSVGVDINVSVPDINININTDNGGTGNSGGESIGDYVDTSGATSDIGDIIATLPKLSKGFTDYLRDFFAWLPPEIYGLVILVLVVTIWKVFAKR